MYTKREDNVKQALELNFVEGDASWKLINRKHLQEKVD